MPICSPNWTRSRSPTGKVRPPISFDDVYAQIEQLGAATGHVAEAAELVGEMQADVTAVQAALPELEEPLTYYHELDDTYFSVTSDTFIGAVYAEIGLVNIADEVGDGNPYPQLNSEFIIAENPDLIFLACTKYCGETAESVAERPGWESTSTHCRPAVSSRWTTTSPPDGARGSSTTSRSSAPRSPRSRTRQAAG